jgi:UTP--glucose-1-phosphate uridylyltransferase
MSDLSAEIDALDPELLARLSRHGFSKDRLLGFARTLRSGTPEERRDKRNRMSGDVTPPTDDELLDIPGDDRTRQLGIDLIKRGGLALCVMAGGMATRMGGVVKALVEAFDGKTFLDVRLAENDAVSKRAGRAVPLWLMTSDATDEPIRHALRGAPAHVETFVQDLSLRLTPSGDLFRTKDGLPSTYATGHGDLPDALRRSGILGRFIQQGGEVIWIANLDNLGATIDPSILGLFLERSEDVMVEICPKANDRGGIPVHAMGKLQVLEEFRLPKDFDPESVRYFNTNTLLVRARSLQNTHIDWTYFEVEKKVEGRPAIQFERLIQELTSAMPSAYVKVPRDGAASRFEPVKDMPELEKRRDAIRAIAKARGFA